MRNYIKRRYKPRTPLTELLPSIDDVLPDRPMSAERLRGRPASNNALADMNAYFRQTYDASWITPDPIVVTGIDGQTGTITITSSYANIGQTYGSPVVLDNPYWSTSQEPVVITSDEPINFFSSERLERMAADDLATGRAHAVSSCDCRYCETVRLNEER